MTADEEVRRCASCSEPAVVLAFEWKQTFNGVSTGSSIRDYRCQNCGARFSLYPKAGSITFIVIGLLLVVTFPMAVLGWLRLRRDGRNPVVPGAPRPQMRFPTGPPARKCAACDNPVSLTRVTRSRHNGIPMGTEYEYACAPCQKSRVIESVWGHLISTFGAVIVGGIGVALLLWSHTPGWRFGGGGVALAICLLIAAQTATRVANRFRYPLVD